MNIAIRPAIWSCISLAVLACSCVASPAVGGSSGGGPVQEDPLLKTITKDPDIEVAEEGRLDEVTAKSPVQRMELNKQVQEDPLVRPDFGAESPGAAAKPIFDAPRRREQQERGSVDDDARLSLPAMELAPTPPSAHAEGAGSGGSEAPTDDDATQKAAASDCLRDHCDDDKPKQRTKDNKVQEDPLLKVIKGGDQLR